MEKRLRSSLQEVLFDVHMLLEKYFPSPRDPLENDWGKMPLLAKQEQFQNEVLTVWVLPNPQQLVLLKSI